MTINEIDRIATAPAPPRIGQGTAVEQSRAVAEVQAAVIVAQQCPRDTQAALKAMRESCRMKRLAEKAFFRYERGGEQVTGPTVQLARELARIWGNISYGISELSRDDEHGQSELQAWAWDLQTNVRPAQIFIVPHARDTKRGVKKLVDMRDIYEHNTNQGARRLRQQIWAVLPPWFVDEAQDICYKTLEDGGGVPLDQRIRKALDLFEAEYGVVEDQVEQRLGRPVTRWTPHDVAQLTVIYKSLQRGEVRVEDEFPVERVTAAEITGQAPPAHPAGAAVDVEDPPDGES